MNPETDECCREKVVVVSVYVEKERRRWVSSTHHRRRDGGGGCRGYNRRAELLDYSHSLRESARCAASTPQNPKFFIPQEPAAAEDITGQGKPKHTRCPKWQILIPDFLKSSTNLQAKNERRKMMKRKKKHHESTATKKKAKRRGFTSRVFSKLFCTQ
ncbi:uncharacterized protein LOC131164226 [Malania oleifera]|uniref:uncharacterized protein LOC131164226 n=1 Tax=Malania oleifera TaxID=397392 RepID=UPI0025ADDED3|nr:uncharacterized protein LOC131164226 [Malania oleifera]